MKVSEFIEWLKTKDPEAEVLILSEERYDYTYTKWVKFEGNNNDSFQYKQNEIVYLELGDK